MAKPYLLQISATEPNKWVTLTADTAEDAIAELVRRHTCPLHGRGFLQAECAQCQPRQAYVALGTARHGNGAPIAVQSYTLEFKRP
jgi:hypothetical protein